MVQVAGRKLGQLGGQHGRRRVGEVPDSIIGELRSLIGHRIGDLAAPMTDVDAPHPARRIDVALAFAIIYVDAFALDDDSALLAPDLLQALPGMKNAPVFVLKVGRIETKVLNHGIRPQVFRVCGNRADWYGSSEATQFMVLGFGMVHHTDGSQKSIITLSL